MPEGLRGSAEPELRWGGRPGGSAPRRRGGKGRTGGGCAAEQGDAEPRGAPRSPPAGRAGSARSRRGAGGSRRRRGVAAGEERRGEGGSGKGFSGERGAPGFAPAAVRPPRLFLLFDSLHAFHLKVRARIDQYFFPAGKSPKRKRRFLNVGDVRRRKRLGIPTHRLQRRLLLLCLLLLYSSYITRNSSVACLLTGGFCNSPHGHDLLSYSMYHLLTEEFPGTGNLVTKRILSSLTDF